MIDFKDTVPMSEPPRTTPAKRVGQPVALSVQKLLGLPCQVQAKLLEAWVALAMLCLLAVATFAPAVAQPEAYHQFADHRALGSLPFAMDVLSNAGFLAGGAWGLWRLGRMSWVALSGPVWVTAVLFFGGLVFTGMGSGLYHWQPDATGLMLDRAAMGVAFAGLLGLAMADRVSGRTALSVALVVLVLAPVAAALAWRGDNATPWLVLQLGGLLVLLVLAAVAPRGRLNGGTWGLPLLSVVLIYALAKGFELADHAVFDITHGWVSGHTLKHVVAALVVLPVWRGLDGVRASTAMVNRMGVTPDRVAQPFAQGKMRSTPVRLHAPLRPLVPRAKLFNSHLNHSAQARHS